jgi:hypothetical protein
VTPATTPSAPRNLTASLNSTTTVSASVTISWDPPEDNGGHPVTGTFALGTPGGSCFSPQQNSCTIPNLTWGTQYTFRAVARNQVGTGDTSEPVQFTPLQATVPNPPTNVSAVAGSGEATVSWTAPAFDGGKPVTGYTVTAAPEGATCNATGAQTQCVVTGLTNGTSYDFTVRAINEEGTSAPSQASAPVTPAAAPGSPGAPTIISSTPGNARVTLSWAAPADSGASAITGYVVTTSPGGAFCAPANPETTECAVTGLTNGQSYTFRVQAVNAAGPGDPSAATSPLTPNAPPEIAYLSPQVYAAGTAIPNLNPVSTGGPITGVSVSPSLPDGLSLHPVSGILAGTPATVTAAADYRIVASGPGGTDTATLNITVNPQAPSNLSYSPDSIVFMKDSAITPWIPAVTGTPSAWSVSPGLPAGLALDPETGKITGTPASEAHLVLYTVTASNISGQATAIIKIEVTGPVSVRPDAFVIRTQGRADPRVFRIPAGSFAATERVTVTITDVWGRTIWTRTVHPARETEREIIWDGTTSTGRAASAGMYIVRFSSLPG